MSTEKPRHVAVIMDGNGRWAQSQGLKRSVGHKEGVKTARQIIEHAAKQKIEVLSLFAFSSENWGRPEEEVTLLMQLFLTALQTEIKKLHKNNICLKIIGNRAEFNPTLQSHMEKAEALTADNTGMTLVIAANYGGQWDIVQAAKALAVEVQAGKLEPAAITPELFSSHLVTESLPAPDLLIRTSGELRLSNFYIWQFAYSEFYFTDVAWPEFNPQHFDDALTQYANRQRRFGYTGEQVE